MSRVGLVTIVSIVLNLFLTFWLINQYMSDIYFQNYVNSAIGQYYPFIVLTIGVGGGSGLGYLFLKKKHGEGGLVGKIQKAKSFKPVGPLSQTASASPLRQILPTGAPPSPVSKHTVYAVPSLPKTSTPSSSRSIRRLPGPLATSHHSNQSYPPNKTRRLGQPRQMFSRQEWNHPDQPQLHSLQLRSSRLNHSAQ